MDDMKLSKVYLDLTDIEALALANRLNVAVSHMIRYGKGETFGTTSQVRSGESGEAQTGVLMVRVYREGNPPT